MRTLLWIGGVALIFALALPFVSAWRWQQASARLATRLAAQADHETAAGRPLPHGTMTALPAVVERYLRRALPDQPDDVARAEIQQEGDFRTSPADDAWRPFSATQTFIASPPGFIWDARIRMAPAMPVFVRDAYVEGRGSMQASVLGLFSVVNEAGVPELDAGALSRFLAESIWFPTRLRPGPRVTWEAIDDRSARATLVDGPTSASLEFRFDEHDDIVEVYAPDRFREVEGRYEPTPWSVTCHTHEVHDGIRIPTECEVAWHLPEGPFPYWRGRVVDVRYTRR